MAAGRGKANILFRWRPFAIGVVHLAPLPGAPRHGEAMGEIIKSAVRDAMIYERTGFDAVIIENFGDAPFYPDRVPAETVASLAVAARAVRENIKIPAGVNCLRNDGLSAVAIAAAAELDFIRINILIGAAVADQGIVVSQAHEVCRARARLAPKLQIFADVQVKHAAPIAQRPIEEEAADLVERALADAVIVSGARTGVQPEIIKLQKVKNAVGGRVPVIVGSGLTLQNAQELLTCADGAIVGTGVKIGSVTNAPVAEPAARKLIQSLRRI